MFEWLEKEMSQIKTNKFHLIHLATDMNRLPQDLVLKLPPSYLEFRAKLGAARLYRQGSHYALGINPSPRIVVKDGKELIEFGWSSRSGTAYFKTALLERDHETPIFEWNRDDGNTVMRRGAHGFEAWLISRCKWARKIYSSDQWKQILNGPPPFTEDERSIVNARKQYDWSVVGFAENGDIQIRVKNNSSRTIPYLSVGVRNKGVQFGGMWLSVGEILPGQEKIIAHDCYKKMLLPENVDVYPLPDPAPEDRSVYWEFRK